MNNIKAIVELTSTGVSVKCSFNFPIGREHYSDDKSYLLDIADYLAYTVNSDDKEDGEGYGFTIKPGDIIYLESMPDLKVRVLNDDDDDMQ